MPSEPGSSSSGSTGGSPSARSASASDAANAINAADQTIAEALRYGAALLAGAGIDNPRLEARLLLAHALDRTSEDLIRDLTGMAPRSDFAALLARRVRREPLAFILGWREFWSLRFRVSPATLIPRPDSETVVEAALTLCPDPGAPIRILDLGTGTGCLLLALLHERRFAFGVGIDRSASAVRLARHNALDLELAERSAFVTADWAAPIHGRFDLVVSNPPYIATAALTTLMPEVVAYEPRAALDGGYRGLTAYRAIVAALPRLLFPGGAAVLELGVGQSEAVGALAEGAGFRTEARTDLSGTARAMILRATP